MQSSTFITIVAAQTVLARTDIESTERISVIIKPTEAQATVRHYIKSIDFLLSLSTSYAIPFQVSQDWPRQPQLFTPAVSQQPFGTAILPGTQPFFMSTTTPTATVAGGQLSNYQNFSGAQPSAAFFSPFGAASHSQAQQSAAAAAPVAKPMLSLSVLINLATVATRYRNEIFTHLQKEVMIAAQEMFKSANKLSRPEKALILGFMAGSRGN